MLFDWHKFHLDEATAPAVVDSRRRLRICLGGFVVLLGVVFGRAVQLEVTQGSAFRAEATRPLLREKSLPGVRGRILARDGTVLARDKKILAVAVRYRDLEQPPDAAWLERLAGLCELSIEEWNRRARRIQTRVRRIAESVRQHRGADITVAEELDYHVMVENVPLAVVAEIEEHPERYSGVKIVAQGRRDYPAGSLAAHVLGHLGPVGKKELDDKQAGYHAEDFVGRTGLERQYESLLRGRRGLLVERTDHSGRLLSSQREREPGIGRDLALTLDPRLQRAAETLLDSAIERRTIRLQPAEPAGGVIVVMDVNTGALLAAVSAPRFDPNLFVGGKTGEVAALLADPAHPLFDRVARMAIPPGSVFKAVSAVTLLESSAVDPQEPLLCQGYLHRPDRQRCAIFVRHGTGHGEVALRDALARSCNVYFFHHAGALGPGPLVDWAGKFGFGRPTGVDLPGETAGRVPSPATIQDLEGHAWQPGNTQSLSIGQGSLTATPLQVVRMMAAIGNGGQLVTPHLVSRLGLTESAEDVSPGEVADDPIHIPSPRPIPGLRQETLASIREGLKRVVSDPDGTAHGTVHLETIEIAGKTGTAETGEDRAAHAWFVGYVPADEPKLALVVVLEHAGDAATAAGPVVKRLVLQMQRLGLL